jgi:hypothetical protein
MANGVGAIRRAALVAVLACTLGVVLGGASANAQPACVGDCNGNQVVAINELILCVNISLGTSQLTSCQACDANNDGTVRINELITAVNNALNGCNNHPTSTPGTPQVGTPTPTVTPATPTTQCPLDAGTYQITSVTGGRLRVGNLAEFDFPAGGEIIADVSPGDAQCVHSAVVPFPGGFTAPAFCIPTLGFTVKVSQTACGIGQMDSNGGADYTVTEIGDTSDTNGPCNLPQARCPASGPAPDNSIRVNVTVGDGTTDTCAGGGTANVISSIPVFTVTWLETGSQCPAVDGSFNPEKGDALISQFPQILDFTTDTAVTKFQDLDGDGCAKSGVGPLNGFPARTGTCLDLDAKTLTTVAAGTVGSTGGPLYDLAFVTSLPNTFARTGDQMHATCESPPLINFNGTVDRCIH